MNAALFVYYTVNPNYYLVTFPLESWIVFFSILCITRMGEYWFSLKKIVLDDARILYAVSQATEARRGSC